VAGVAVALPDGVERTVARGTQGMIIGPDNPAKADQPEAAQPARMTFALFKEPGIKPSAAVIVQQYAFTAIKDLLRIVPVFCKGPPELLRFVFHWQGGGGTHGFGAIEHNHSEAVGRGEIGGEVVFLILKRSVVEIGKVPEYADPKPGQIGDVRFKFIAGKCFDGKHGGKIGKLQIGGLQIGGLRIGRLQIGRLQIGGIADWGLKIFLKKSVRDHHFLVHMGSNAIKTGRNRMNSQELEQRLIQFAVRIFKLCDEFPKTPAGRHVAGQMIRSGSSPAFNYGEAQRAESIRDFVHKMQICLKELNETSVALQIASLAKFYKTKELMDSLKDECHELISIFVSSVNTAKKRRARGR
jgi:four helix bundle protein